MHSKADLPATSRPSVRFKEKRQVTYKKTSMGVHRAYQSTSSDNNLARNMSPMSHIAGTALGESGSVEIHASALFRVEARRSRS